MTGTEPMGSAAGFGSSWWATAWLDALEQRAQLDPNRLPRGVACARSGDVGELLIGPGEVRAQVRGRERDPYQVRIRVRTFDNEQWAQVLGAIAAQAGHTAAMLDGQIPPRLAVDAAELGLGLLPGPGELGPRCTCPDEADPCKHAAAVCYLAAEALDRNPFLVLTMRGRTQGEVLAGLRALRRAGDRARSSPADPDPATAAHDPARPSPVADDGLDARAVFASAPPDLASPPLPPLPPQRPGRPGPLPIDLPLELSELRADLLTLASDAARRAWELATGASSDAGLGLDPDADLARRADAALGTVDFGPLVANSGVAERELAQWALAWRHGGHHGFETLRAGWDPATEGEPGSEQLLVAAQAAVKLASGRTTRRRLNQITVTGLGLQVRFGRDDQWYPYRRIGTSWEPAGQPHHDAAVALAPLLPGASPRR